MKRPETQQKLTGMRVAVTGAGGFIGRHLVAALREEGVDVTAILRSGHDRATIVATGAAAVVAPLVPGRALASVLAGQDAVCHLAYDVRADGAANLAAFEALLQAAEAAGVGRIVHASSVVVYDGWPGGTLSEATPIGGPGGGPGGGPVGGPVGGPYRQAKIAMERRLIAGPLPAVILQPTIVYGPGSALWTDRPLAALRRGGVVLPDPPGLCPAVHGADVAGAALAALALPDPGRERFLISGPDRMTWADFYRGYAGLLGQGEVRLEPLADLAARLGPAPVPGAAPSGPSAAARISAALRRVLGSRRFDRLLARLADRRGPAVTWPDRAALALYAARGDIDTSAARDRLGFTPRLSFAQGLETIRAQYRL